MAQSQKPRKAKPKSQGKKSLQAEVRTDKSIAEIAQGLETNTPSLSKVENTEISVATSNSDDYVTLTQNLTHSVTFKKGSDLFRILDAVTFQGKNLFQCTLYVIRQIVTSFEGGQLKSASALTANQLNTIAQVNAVIAQVNLKRTERFNSDAPARGPTQRDAEGKVKPKKLNLLPLFEFKPEVTAEDLSEVAETDVKDESAVKVETDIEVEHSESLSATAFTILDITLLDNVMRQYKDDKGRHPYLELPSTFASAIVLGVVGMFTTYLKSVREWKENPAKFSGGKKPQMPSYKDKQGRLAITLPLANLGSNLPKITDKDICYDFDKEQPVTDEDKQKWNSFSIDKFIDEARVNSGYPANTKAVSIRIVPKSNKVKVEVVFEVPYQLHKDCFLIKIENEARIELTKDVASKLVKDGTCPNLEAAAVYLADPKNKQLTNFTQKRVDHKVVRLLSNIKQEELPSIAGLDMGLSNIATISYAPSIKALTKLMYSTPSGNTASDGKPTYINPVQHFKSSVISNQRHEGQLLKYDLKLDKLKSSLLSEATRLLQSRKDKGEELTKEEYRQLRSGLNEAYATSEYRRLSERRQQSANNNLHKLSHNIIKNILDKGSQVLCIGKNLGWKDEVDMGKKMNRRFYRTSHAQLIELLQYKARMAGIIVVLTEESYSSKSSFRLNEKLRVKDSDMEGETHQSLGSRNKSESWFTSKGADLGKWWRIHDDVNGAFNIIRKVFKHFKWHDKLSPLINIMWLSPKKGLTRACLKPKTMAKTVDRCGLVESKHSEKLFAMPKGNDCLTVK